MKLTRDRCRRKGQVGARSLKAEKVNGELLKVKKENPDVEAETASQDGVK